MRLWRISSERYARDFEGGFGIANNGRWNTRGRPVTYCSTVASLSALEKRVHVTSPVILPPQSLVIYDVPDDVTRHEIGLSALPPDWVMRQAHTQAIGDAWLNGAVEMLLFVPSVVLPLSGIPDRNVLINHRAPGADSIRIAAVLPFNFDPRLFSP